MTDGNVSIVNKGSPSMRATLSSRDKDWLSIISMTTSHDDLIKTNAKGESTIKISNTKIARLLQSYGCVPHKSLTMEMPDIPAEHLPDFLRGCIDGDGSIFHGKVKQRKGDKEYLYTKSSVYLCSASLLFLQKLSELLRNLGYKHYWITLLPKERKIHDKIIQPKNTVYRLLFNGPDCVKFLSWIYYPGHNISMPRKHDRARVIINQV